MLTRLSDRVHDSFDALHRELCRIWNRCRPQHVPHRPLWQGQGHHAWSSDSSHRLCYHSSTSSIPCHSMRLHSRRSRRQSAAGPNEVGDVSSSRSGHSLSCFNTSTYVALMPNSAQALGYLHGGYVRREPFDQSNLSDKFSAGSRWGYKSAHSNSLRLQRHKVLLLLLRFSSRRSFERPHSAAHLPPRARCRTFHRKADLE